MVYLLNDGAVDVEGTYRRLQYDNGSPAGSPPDFDGSAYGVKPAPYAAPVPIVPRLGTMPILIAGPGITPNAPKGDEGAPMEPAAPLGAPSPTLTPAQAILDGSAAPSPTGDAAAAPFRVDWRTVALGALVLTALWFALGERDE